MVGNGAKRQSPLCRLCGAPLRDTFLDLGLSPLANSYLKAEQLNRAETYYPLRVFICRSCLLVQVEVFETPEQIFSDYAYFRLIRTVGCSTQRPM